MFLKRRVRHRDGKEHVYYSVCESLRVHGGRTIQRQVLHPGELNTTQIESWQHTIAIISEEDGERLQRRLFTDREGTAPPDAEDVIEVRLSTLRVRHPRRFGDCRAGCRLWQELGLDAFWREQLSGVRGAEPWEKVLELLAVNRLPDPRSELYYLVGTPKHQLSQFEAQLTEKGWSAAAPGVAVKLCPEDEDIYVLCRSEGRVEKEHAMRRRALRACVRDLVKLRRTVAAGRLKDPDTIQQRLGGLKERHRPVCRYLSKLVHEEGAIVGNGTVKNGKRPSSATAPISCVPTGPASTIPPRSGKPTSSSPRPKPPSAP